MDTAAASGLFTGRVVIVTGGAMGIGRATAIAFARAGAAVAIADVDVAAGQATVTDCERAAAEAGSGGRALLVTADVANAAACRQGMPIQPFPIQIPADWLRREPAGIGQLAATA